MNIFKTIPAAFQVEQALRVFNTHGPEFDQLKAAGEYEKLRARILETSQVFAHTLVDKWGLDIEVVGKENMPDSGPMLIVSNHQSFADILAMYYVFDKFQIGFIAKADFYKWKTLATAVKNTQSLFIVRGDAREAIQTLKEATEMLNNGFTLVIYPEGTRSHCHDMGEFKAGSFKFAQKGKVPILPVTIDGGYHLFEEKNSFQNKIKIRVIIHPLVHYENMTRQEQNAANVEIENTIRNALTEYDPV